MLYFSCDYAEGCHPKVLEALTKTNMVSTPGYGEDVYCSQAKEKIKEYINCPDADICFLVGGTQTNQTVIDSILTSYEGVIAARTGHIAVHEAGAIEHTGHKVLDLPCENGKIKAQDLNKYLKDFYADGNHEHMVSPGMVYISYPTEYGTLYSKEELLAIYNICQEFKLPLFIDGARLGYGLAANSGEMTMADIASLCDVFYIGGTKVGLLLGEAVIFPKGNMPKHYTTIIKQHGALLAKGRVLGVQFAELFTDDLYNKISKNAIDAANKIRAALKEKNYQFYIPNPTNQIFIVVDNEWLEKYKNELAYGFWEKYDDTHTVIRIATSWATNSDDVDALIKLL